MYRERHIRVRLLAAGVVLDVSLRRDTVHGPFLVRRDVVDGVGETVVVTNVQLITAMRPRDEDDLALLSIEREVLHVEGAVRLDERRIEPKYVSIGAHYRVRHHVVVEFVASAETAFNDRHVIESPASVSFITCSCAVMHVV